jgi:hypothetical protein
MEHGVTDSRFHKNRTKGKAAELPADFAVKPDARFHKNRTKGKSVDGPVDEADAAAPQAAPVVTDATKATKATPKPEAAPTTAADAPTRKMRKGGEKETK